MSLKDNFNQAVKEILKKDGLVGDNLSKGSRKKTKYFCGKRSRNGDYRQLRKRLTKSKVCGDEVSYTFLKRGVKNYFYGGDELRRI